MWHLWRSHMTHSRHLLRGGTCHEVMSHIWQSHGTHMKESCHTYEGVISRIWIRHVKRSRHTRGGLETGELATKKKRKVLKKIPGQLEASFLMFPSIGSIKQSNAFYGVAHVRKSCHTHEGNDWWVPYMIRSLFSFFVRKKKYIQSYIYIYIYI